MFTRDDLSNNLINNSNKVFIDILLDFLNNFFNTYHILNRYEILKRINKLEYIGYEDRTKGYICDDDKACFGSGFYFYIALNRNVTDKNLIKAYLYHELIHCLSLHIEDKKEINGFKKPFIFSPIFDEIMTEYYAHTLLQKENINFENKYIYEEDNNHKLYSTYNGCGYHKYMGLAKIYDFIFNYNLLKGKFVHNKSLINEINDLINNSDLSLDYDEFINCDDPIKRYYDITLLFITKLKNNYNEDNKDNIVDDSNITNYLELILKEDNGNKIKPYKEIDIMILNEIYKYLYSQNKRKIL